MKETPKPGERWRVTIEDTVSHLDGMWVGFVNGPGQDFRRGTWERLPDPEPDWQPGDLVLDVRGKIWQRGAGGQSWMAVSAAGWMDVPSRPLRRLVVAE